MAGVCCDTCVCDGVSSGILVGRGVPLKFGEGLVMEGAATQEWSSGRARLVRRLFRLICFLRFRLTVLDCAGRAGGVLGGTWGALIRGEWVGGLRVSAAQVSHQCVLL